MMTMSKGIPQLGMAKPGVSTLPFEDRVVPNSVCTEDTLARLRREYQIPDTITLTLPHRGYDVYTPADDKVLLHVIAFECGVRLPLHPTLRKAPLALSLAPLQISPGFWKHLVGFLVL